MEIDQNSHDINRHIHKLFDNRKYFEACKVIENMRKQFNAINFEKYVLNQCCGLT